MEENNQNELNDKLTTAEKIKLVILLILTSIIFFVLWYFEFGFFMTILISGTSFFVLDIIITNMWILGRKILIKLNIIKVKNIEVVQLENIEEVVEVVEVSLFDHLQTLTIQDLKLLAKSSRIPYIANASKEELINIILDFEGVN